MLLPPFKSIDLNCGPFDKNASKEAGKSNFRPTTKRKGEKCETTRAHFNNQVDVCSAYSKIYQLWDDNDDYDDDDEKIMWR